MNARPTLREVARHSGLSIKTISRVVNGDANVAPSTEQRVREAIAALGYRPNLVARSLRVGRDNAIGIVVTSISDPFFADLTAAVEEGARERNFLVMITCTGEGTDQEETMTSGLLTRQIAGMILVPTSEDQGYLEAAHAGMPLVCVDRPPIGLDCDCVLVDNEAAAFEATRWLLAHGHTRIGFIGGPGEKFTIRLRREGYERALQDAGIAVDREAIDDSAILPSEVSDIVPRLLGLADPITAILTSNAKASLGVVGALHRAKRTDVAMVGFDDFPTADALVPPVTVVSQDASHIGRAAVELLFKRISGGGGESERMVLPTTLVVRGSGELPPSRRRSKAAVPAG